MQQEFQEEFPEMEQPPAPKNAKLRTVFLWQLVLGVALLAALGGMKFMAPELYTQVCGQLKTALDGPNFKTGAEQFWNSIVGFINGFTPLGSGTPADPSSAASQAQPVQEVAYPGEPLLPLTGRVTSAFGERENPVSSSGEQHNGVDIAAEEGTPVVAMDGGTVERAGWSDTAGENLLIDHQNGFESLYAHCAVLSVSQGEQVQKGQEVAQSGSTGQATGPHLHFGVSQNGVWINPALLPGFEGLAG